MIICIIQIRYAVFERNRFLLQLLWYLKNKITKQTECKIFLNIVMQRLHIVSVEGFILFLHTNISDELVRLFETADACTSVQRQTTNMLARFHSSALFFSGLQSEGNRGEYARRISF